MRTAPTPTSGRRLLALVATALVLGGASVGLDAATAHGSAHQQHDRHGHAQRDHQPA